MDCVFETLHIPVPRPVEGVEACMSSFKIAAQRSQRRTLLSASSSPLSLTEHFYGTDFAP